MEFKEYESQEKDLIIENESKRLKELGIMEENIKEVFRLRQLQILDKIIKNYEEGTFLGQGESGYVTAAHDAYNQELAIKFIKKVRGDRNMVDVQLENSLEIEAGMQNYIAEYVSEHKLPCRVPMVIYTALDVKTTKMVDPLPTSKFYDKEGTTKVPYKASFDVIGMEKINGKTLLELDSILNEVPAFDPSQFLENLIISIKNLHRYTGFHHRALHKGNIMVDYDNPQIPVILDFGRSMCLSYGKNVLLEQIDATQDIYNSDGTYVSVWDNTSINTGDLNFNNSTLVNNIFYAKMVNIAQKEGVVQFSNKDHLELLNLQKTFKTNELI